MLAGGDFHRQTDTDTDSETVYVLYDWFMLYVCVSVWWYVCRHDDAMRALDASHEKRFFGSKVTVSVHEGIGKTRTTLSPRPSPAQPRTDGTAKKIRVVGLYCNVGSVRTT